MSVLVQNVSTKLYKDSPIIEKECINNVQKRSGNLLRAVKKATKGLAGRGKLRKFKINNKLVYLLRAKYSSSAQEHNYKTLLVKILSNHKKKQGTDAIPITEIDN